MRQNDIVPLLPSGSGSSCYHLTILYAAGEWCQTINIRKTRPLLKCGLLNLSLLQEMPHVTYLSNIHKGNQVSFFLNLCSGVVFRSALSLCVRICIQSDSRQCRRYRYRISGIVADTRIVINPRSICVLIREPVYMKMRQLLSRNISVYPQLSDW